MDCGGDAAGRGCRPRGAGQRPRDARRATHDSRPGSFPRGADSEGDVSRRGGTRRCLRAGRMGSRRTSQARHGVQQPARPAHLVADRGPQQRRFPRADAARAAGQRRRALGTQSRQGRSDRAVGRGRSACPRRQAVDPELRGSSDAREGARRGRSQGRRGLRHHDRALRDGDHPPARARQRRRRLRSGRAGHRGRAWRLHGKRASPDEDGGRRAEHQAGVVLRHHGAG